MFDRRRIQAGEKVPLQLKPEQRNLILERTWTPPALADRLRFGVKEKDLLSFSFTLPELAQLAMHIASEAERAEDPRLQEQLDEIYGRIVWVLDVFEEEDTGDDEPVSDLLGAIPLDQMPEGMRAAVIELLQDPTIETTDQLQERLIALAEDFSHRGNIELGGLSPLQVVELLGANWDDPQGPIRFNKNLPLEKLQGSSLLVNARTMLREIDEAGGIKMTEAGNLSRAFVNRLLDIMVFPPGAVEQARLISKVINEQDFWPIHKVRVLVEVAKYARKHAGKFKITKAGKAALADKAAGELFENLFVTTFRAINLDYFDPYHEAPGVQEGVPFSLYVIAREANDWQVIEEFVPRMLLPFVKAEIPPLEGHNREVWVAYGRILHHLEDFGLIEVREGKSRHGVTMFQDFRKTPLYDEFLSFHLSE